MLDGGLKNNICNLFNIKIMLLVAEIVQVYIYRNHYTYIIVIIQIIN